VKIAASNLLTDAWPEILTPADQFFAALFRGQSGILELRTVALANTPYEGKIAARFRDFVPVQDGRFDGRRVSRFLTNVTARKMAAYFGVALRTPQAAIDRKGTVAYCQSLTTLFADCDFKALGEVETRARLSEFAIAPSAVVHSGGGLHVYWFLRDPLDLHTVAGVNDARSRLRGLAKAIVGIVDISCCEPARVLRVPGSLNFKKAYGEPRPVVLEKI
jgi:hypothetical protein